MDEIVDLSMLLRLTNGAALAPVDIPIFDALKANVDLNDIVNATVDQRIAKFSNTFAATTYEKAVLRLRAFQDEISELLMGCLSEWTIPDALALSRHLHLVNPIESFESADAFARNIRILELAIVRYCSYESPRNEIDEDGCWEINLDREKISALLMASNLAQLLGLCQVDLRRLAYGGQLLGHNSGWTVQLDTELEHLASSFERRLGLFGNSMKHAGVPGVFGLPQGKGDHWLFLAGKNDGRWLWAGALSTHIEAISTEQDSFVSASQSYVPTMMLAAFNFDRYVETLQQFDEAFRREGFALQVALSLLHVAATMGEEQYSSYIPGHRLRTLGFTLVSRSKLIQSAMEWSASLGHDNPSFEFQNALAFFERSERDPELISFNESSGAQHFIRLGDTYELIDFQTSFSALRRLFDVVGKVDGQQANERASSFERHVARALQSAFPQGRVIWLSQDLRFSDNTNREVDVAFLLDETLFLCECKARRNAVRPDGLTRSVVMNLSRDHENQLSRADSLGSLLSTVSLKGLRLPDAAKRFVSCIITPSVEWMSSTDQRFWLSPGVPRICVVDELIDALAGDDKVFNSIDRYI